VPGVLEMPATEHTRSVPPFPPGYRASGILLQVTSRPSTYGIGDLGLSAYAWIVRLHEAGQGWWQALPLGPTGYGNSPYQLLSLFPDIWKIEGLARREHCEKVLAAARREDRNRVGCIILGRGEDHRKVREWLTVASGVPSFIGFAVGRTCFWDPLLDWRAQKITREDAVAEIARRYRECVEIFENQHKLAHASRDAL